MVEWTGNPFVKKGYCIKVVLGNVNWSHRYINFFSLGNTNSIASFFTHRLVALQLHSSFAIILWDFSMMLKSIRLKLVSHQRRVLTTTPCENLQILVVWEDNSTPQLPFLSLLQSIVDQLDLFRCSERSCSKFVEDKMNNHRTLHMIYNGLQYSKVAKLIFCSQQDNTSCGNSQIFVCVICMSSSCNDLQLVTVIPDTPT